ncbi:hypothetical protein A2U01_0117145, partial [Trifolium medium]|nr:hypothetical protein [Trifolium medium]
SLASLGEPWRALATSSLSDQLQ